MKNKLKKNYYSSVRLSGNVAIGTAKFCVKHAELLAVVVACAAVASAELLYRSCSSEKQQNTMSESERIRIQRENMKLARERMKFQREYLMWRNVCDNDKDMRILANGIKECISYIIEKIREVKSGMLENLDEKKSILNEWADQKIKEYNVHDKGLSKYEQNSMSTVVSNIDKDKDDLPTYEDVINEKKIEEELRLRQSTDERYIPSAPSIEIVFGSRHGRCVDVL